MAARVCIQYQKVSRQHKSRSWAVGGYGSTAFPSACTALQNKTLYKLQYREEGELQGNNLKKEQKEEKTASIIQVWPNCQREIHRKMVIRGTPSETPTLPEGQEKCCSWRTEYCGRSRESHSVCLCSNACVCFCLQTCVR